MTEQDRRDIKEIVTDAIQSLKELFVEKLNGHGNDVQRALDHADKLYTIGRMHDSQITALQVKDQELAGRIDKLESVTRLEEDARDKRETAVGEVVDKSKAQGQFSTTTWVSIALALLSAGIAVWAVLQ